MDSFVKGFLLSFTLLLAYPLTLTAAEIADLTACAVVSAADAEKFVGGPLDVTKIDKKIMLNAPWTHDSLCTYISQGDSPDNPASSARLIDVALRFFNSADDAVRIHQAMIDQYRKIAAVPDAPFKFTTLEPLEGFADGAFLLEVSADPASDYKSAQIIFHKGKIGGSISAWKKPDASLETTKAVLRHILSKLP